MSAPPRLQIVHPDSGVLLEQVRALFREYQQSLGVDLCFQNFEQELAALPGAYAPPSGRLFLGLADGRPAGCVALRQPEPATAEMP
jgi:hypothetical protein